jgi:formylglycine-generating enzyme required for sulfatase activity/tRNA A-37 threonylcarbamoyl transferase component Bud32
VSVERERIGPYRILDELGRGGESVVYLAEDTRLDRRVALKVFVSRPGFRRRRLEAFRHEADSAGRLEHPGICATHEAGVHEGLPYLAMQYVAGRTLAAGIGGPAPAPVREAIAIVEQAARAVHAAHEAGIVHGDLKPGNIMVTPEGEAVVLDFGVAGEDNATPAYLAPEQIESDYGRPDRRTDVYGLGATLYEALTLQRPFAAPTREGLLRSVLHEEAPDPRRISSHISKDLAVVVTTALAKEQDRRYQTTLDLAADLRAVREARPVRARPAGPWLRCRRWSRRNPALAAIMVALVLTLAGGLAATGVFLAQTLASLETARREHDLRLLPELIQTEANSTWPALPWGVGEMDAWLAEAEGLRARSDGRPDQLDAAIDRVRARRQDAATIAARSVDGYADRWRETLKAIAEDPRYADPFFAPQVGLVPLGRDPDTGLLEFGHLQSGALAKRDPATSRLIIKAETGLVFVLLPGSVFDMGAIPPDDAHSVASPNVDPDARPDEAPVRRVAVEPFFISKYEMTQAQWVRLAGHNPSHFRRDNPRTAWRPAPDDLYSPLQPVESVTAGSARAVLGRLGLQLPTEAQWEYAARAGTSTIWWTGDDPEAIRWVSNVAGRNLMTLAVGRFPANPFGLHDVAGNVSELVAETDGELSLTRGGGSGQSVVWARSAARYTSFGAGVRPARAITRWESAQADTTPDVPQIVVGSRVPVIRRPGGRTTLADGAVTIPIDPRATYLRSAWNDDQVLPARAIDLAALGIHPGDRIRLERIGTWGSYVGGDITTSMIGVFSASDVLLPPREVHRVADAIEAGIDIRTHVASEDGQPTDITEDFGICDWYLPIGPSVCTEVPPGATHLFVTSHDHFYEDNRDADGNFGVRISFARSSCPEPGQEPTRDGTDIARPSGELVVPVSPAQSDERPAIARRGRAR